jgi:hypothetical protein
MQSVLTSANNESADDDDRSNNESACYDDSGDFDNELFQDYFDNELFQDYLNRQRDKDLEKIKARFLHMHIMLEQDKKKAIEGKPPSKLSR